eukprot:GHVS01100696.1.p1 GENE.GHVS01100696.1~~GHVS01100696.1.p1  ORF type:complete len:514 (+),score=100.66 GHVS01100696.1:129-1670(+)
MPAASPQSVVPQISIAEVICFDPLARHSSHQKTGSCKPIGRQRAVVRKLTSNDSVRPTAAVVSGGELGGCGRHIRVSVDEVQSACRLLKALAELADTNHRKIADTTTTPTMPTVTTTTTTASPVSLYDTENSKHRLCLSVVSSSALSPCVQHLCEWLGVVLLSANDGRRETIRPADVAALMRSLAITSIQQPPAVGLMNAVEDILIRRGSTFHGIDLSTIISSYSRLDNWRCTDALFVKLCQLVPHVTERCNLQDLTMFVSALTSIYTTTAYTHLSPLCHHNATTATTTATAATYPSTTTITAGTTTDKPTELFNVFWNLLSGHLLPTLSLQVDGLHPHAIGSLLYCINTVLSPLDNNYTLPHQHNHATHHQLHTQPHYATAICPSTLLGASPPVTQSSCEDDSSIIIGGGGFTVDRRYSEALALRLNAAPPQAVAAGGGGSSIGESSMAAFSAAQHEEPRHDALCGSGGGCSGGGLSVGIVEALESVRPFLECLHERIDISSTQVFSSFLHT